MRALIARLHRHRLVRQALAIGGWQSLAKVVAFFASVWATRCLGPQKLGLSGMVIAMMGQLWLFATPFLDIHLTRRFKALKSEEERKTLISVVFTWRLAVCLVLGAIALPIALLALKNDWMLATIAAFPLLLFVSNPATWLLMAQEKMPAHSKSTAIQSIITGLLYVAVFRPGQAVGSDVAVLAAATGVGWLYGWWAALGRVWPAPLNFRQLKAMLPVLSEGRWLIAAMLCATFTQSLETPLLGALASLPELGQYRTAQSLTAVVAQFLAFVPTLLYPRFIEWHKLGGNILWRRQLKLAGAAGAVTLLAVIVCFAISPLTYRVLYGPEFERAAYPFAILMVAKFIALISGIFTWGLWAQSEDRRIAQLMAPIAILSLALNVLLIPRLGMFAAAGINLLSEALLLAGAVWLATRTRTSTVDQRAALVKTLDEP